MAFTIRCSAEDFRISLWHAEARTFSLRRVIIGGAKVSDRATGDGEIGKRGKFMRSKIYAHEGWGTLEANLVRGAETGASV